MDRRHFLMGAAAAPATVRPGVAASPNDTIRVACVGVHGQGEVHINAYLKMPNVEIAALCDVDEAVLAKGCKMVEAAGKKRPAALHRLPQSCWKTSRSTPSPSPRPTTTTPCRPSGRCQAGKDVYVEKPCSHNMFEARQIVAAARKYNRMVQHGTSGRSRLAARGRARRCARA